MSMVIQRPRRTRRRAVNLSNPRPAQVANRPRTSAQVAKRKKARTQSQTMAVVMAVGCVALLVYVLSAVVGNTALEKARRDRLRMQERSKAMQVEVAKLRRELDTMTSMMRVDEFAQSSGLVLSGQELQRKPEQIVPELRESTPQGQIVAQTVGANLASVR